MQCGCAAALKGMAAKGRQHLIVKSGGCRHAIWKRSKDYTSFTNKRNETTQLTMCLSSWGGTYLNGDL